MTLPTTLALTADSVRSARLDNGLTVLVLPDSQVPSLAYFTCYRVGSRNERPGITGISHLFEHMMFNGARKHGPRMFDVAIESNGGLSNAYTTHDVTTYYEVVPSDKLDLVLDLEADRMRDLELSERNLASEREVVKEERRLRTDESPIGSLYEHLYAVAFMAHPYRWPVIGWMADIDAISVADIQDYFKRHYSPDNAIVAIAGDIDPDRALDQAASVLGGLPVGAERAGVIRSEPEQRGQRRVVERKEAQVATLGMAYHACDSRSPDLHAFDVLQSALADGDSSRLRRRLVLEDQLAVDADADFPWMLDPAIFTVLVTLVPGADPARVEAIVREEVRRLAEQPMTETELRKVKNQIQADTWRRLKTNEGRADLLCTSEVVLGSHRDVFALPERYEAVTVEDVQRVAAQAFREDNETVALLDPILVDPAASSDDAS